jgi:hypothetical protein
MSKPIRVLAAVVAAALAGPTVVSAADPQEAERRYRVARRLAAERSPQAAEALRGVLDADPTGELADDARVELALLAGAPGSTAELGRLSAASRAEARTLLSSADVPAADRAVEARFRLALLDLEPLPGRDPARARVLLLAIATDPAAGPWALRARSALAWLDAVEGRFDRAVTTWQRIRIEWRGTPEADVALAGLARVHAHDGRFSAAVEAVAERPATHGDMLAESVVRGALRAAGAGGAWVAADARTVVPPAARGSAVVHRGPDGDVLLFDDRADAVVTFGADGRERRRRAVADVDAVVRDPFGRDWIAAGERLSRSSATGFSPLASLDRLAPASALAVDTAGVVYVLDRKGTRIGAVYPGDATPRSFWSPPDGRVVGLAWDGRRLITADARGGALFAIDRQGDATRIPTGAFQRPGALAADDLGRVAVFDDRAGVVVLLGPDGRERDRIAVESLGVRRVGGVTLGPDGSLDVLDAASGRLVRLP